MPYNLDQKTIIITGANSGIGKAAAIQLAKLGANVIMACRSAQRGAQALEDIRKASAPSRIITVASKGLGVYPSLDIEFNNLNGEHKYSTQHAYYHSKQAQVMFTYDLAERLKGSGVTVNCVRVTNVAIPDERLTHLPKWQLKIYQLKRGMAITPERQAETYVYLAADPAVQNITGGYWDENNRQVRSNAKSYNIETWKRLWQVSSRMTGIES